MDVFIRSMLPGGGPVVAGRGWTRGVQEWSFFFLRYISGSSHNPSVVPDDSQNGLLSLLTAFLPLA